MSLHAEVKVRTADVTDEIDGRIYGQYIENVEPDDRVIYGGVCDDEGELRAPVVEALRRMKVPVIRWGGNYADLYQWRDGIGPKATRPSRPNYFWGGQESNRFGTHEFLELCDALSAVPFININMGTGSLLEALGWLEYCNYDGDTAYTELRANNGRAEPWQVPIWGIGNEAWGHWEACFSSAHDYVHDFNQYAQYMRRLDPDIEIVAVGHTDRQWNKTVLSGMLKPAEYLSVHMYGHSYLDRPGNTEQLVALPVAFDHELGDIVRDVGAISAGPIAIAVDEWNVRHFSNGKLNRKSPRQLQDALFAAGVFHVMQRFSPWVRIANYVTMVNGNAPLRAWDETITVTPLYEAFRLYQQYMTGSSAKVSVESPRYDCQPFDWVSTPHQRVMALSAPYIDTSAAVSQSDGIVSVALINRHVSQYVSVSLELNGGTGYSLREAVTLTGDSPTALTARVTDSTGTIQLLGPNRWQVELQPFSIAWLRWHKL